jgi:hypothetical protein
MGKDSNSAGYKANAGKRKEEMKNRATWIPNPFAADHADNKEREGKEELSIVPDPVPERLFQASLSAPFCMASCYRCDRWPALQAKREE